MHDNSKKNKCILARVAQIGTVQQHVRQVGLYSEVSSSSRCPQDNREIESTLGRKGIQGPVRGNPFAAIFTWQGMAVLIHFGCSEHFSCVKLHSSRHSLGHSRQVKASRYNNWLETMHGMRLARSRVSVGLDQKIIGALRQRGHRPRRSQPAWYQ